MHESISCHSQPRGKRRDYRNSILPSHDEVFGCVFAELIRADVWLWFQELYDFRAEFNTKNIWSRQSLTSCALYVECQDVKASARVEILRSYITRKREFSRTFIGEYLSGVRVDAVTNQPSYYTSSPQWLWLVASCYTALTSTASVFSFSQPDLKKSEEFFLTQS